MYQLHVTVMSHWFDVAPEFESGGSRADRDEMLSGAELCVLTCSILSFLVCEKTSSVV
jgi:hypothetical protein